MLNKHYKNDNSSWISKYLIRIYGFLAMWKAKGDNRGKRNINTKLYNIYLNGKRVEMADDITIYR